MNPEFHPRWIIEAREEPTQLRLHLRVLDKLMGEKVVGQATINFEALVSVRLEPDQILKLIFKLLDTGKTLTEAINILVDENAPWRKLEPEELEVENIFQSLKADASEEIKDGKPTETITAKQTNKSAKRSD